MKRIAFAAVYGGYDRSVPILLAVAVFASCAWSQSFEVASIRPRADDGGVGLRVDGSRLTANITITA